MDLVSELELLAKMIRETADTEHHKFSISKRLVSKSAISIISGLWGFKVTTSLTKYIVHLQHKTVYNFNRFQGIVK